MDPVDVIRAVGISHLVQPPVTAYLASSKGIGLKNKILATSPDAGCVIRNMGFASVFLPTALGVLLCVHAQEAATGGAARAHAWLLAAFWTWRLVRQVELHAAWERGRRAWSWLLFGVFLVQGPALAATLLLTR